MLAVAYGSFPFPGRGATERCAGDMPTHRVGVGHLGLREVSHGVSDLSKQIES